MIKMLMFLVGAIVEKTFAEPVFEISQHNNVTTLPRKLNSIVIL